MSHAGELPPATGDHFRWPEQEAQGRLVTAIMSLDNPAVLDVLAIYPSLVLYRVPLQQNRPALPLELALVAIGNGVQAPETAGAQGVAVIRSLLNAKADPNGEIRLQSWTSGEEHTTNLRLVVGPLLMTILPDHYRESLVGMLLAAGADPLATGGGDTYTPLMEGALCGCSVLIVQQLLDAKAACNDRRASNGCTALYIACEHGTSHDIISLLLDAKADPNLTNSRFNTSALRRCALNADEKGTRLLLAAGAQPSAGCLQTAVMKRSHTIVKRLIEAKAEATNEVLALACASRADVLNWEDLTITDWAAREPYAPRLIGALAVVKTLIAAGAGPLRALVDCSGQERLDVAISQGEETQTRLFLAAGLRCASPAVCLNACPQDRRLAILKRLITYGQDGLPPPSALGLELDSDAFRTEYFEKRGKFCAWCEEPAARGKLQVCSRCKAVYYCSTPCQKQDWKCGGHKHVCIQIKN